MSLQRWLQFHTAALAVLGGWFLLLTGDSSPFPYALAIATLVALLVTDIKNWVKLPRTLGNVGALVAVGWSMRNFMRQVREDQLLTISHMLIYLQIVLVFQEKSRRVYWQLLVLSVLQVVVTAALSLGPQFGLLLVLYMANAVACMMLLCYQREVSEGTPRDALAGKSPTSLHRLLDPPTLRISGPRREQLENWIRAPWLVRSVLMFTSASFLFTLVFFFSAPRLSEALWQTSRVRGTVSGFSGEVVLKTRGRIELSDQPVMRVSFKRDDNRETAAIVTEPYFHGQVLTKYQQDEYGARWSYQPAFRLQRANMRPHVVQATRPGELVRQDIILEATNSPVLFAMMPVHFLPETPTGIREFRQSPRLIRFGQEDQIQSGREYRYTIGTLAIRNGRQLPAVPHFNPALTEQEKSYLITERKELCEFSVDRFPGTKEIADSLIRDLQLEKASTLARATALQNLLFSSGSYSYSLDLRDPQAATGDRVGIDPLEDFVVHRRQGHCEYFASALVIMLRSQGIPARLVIGYKGGDWNALGEYFLVRQRHAHAWVEVLLEPHEVPEDELAGTPSNGGAWYRLDPTPGSSEAGPEAIQEKRNGRFSDAFDYAECLWRDYVLGLNAGRQDSVLDPITTRSRDVLPKSMDPARWQRWAQSMMGGKPVAASGNLQAAEKRDSEEAAVKPSTPWFRFLLLAFFVIVLPAAMAGVLLSIRFLLHLLWQRDRSAKASVSEMFAGIQRAVQRRGVVVRPQTTANELLSAVAGLGEAGSGPAVVGQSGSLTGMLRTVIDRYHRLRFSGQATDGDKRALVEGLAQLQQATATSSATNKAIYHQAAD
ncbi:transglutaminase family protein [Anatilimnocola aggregata]|nr:DUF3488 and transglutaminase-like domain-containing protein [Anatilimnocola aggregata]